MELYDKIDKLAHNLGFADWGCAKATSLEREMRWFQKAQERGFFGEMDYLNRNSEKRQDPTLLLEGAKSVMVFLVPFSYHSHNRKNDNSLKVSEFALGEDYHTVIKNRLNQIANCIDLYLIENNPSMSEITENPYLRKKYFAPNFDKYKSLSCRVFTDSAPVMERAWAVRAGLGFIGKNNFLISRSCGVKNFIGVIITTAELPYSEEYPDEERGENCGKCTQCIDACSCKALFAPREIDARKCLSYKTIEAPVNKSCCMEFSTQCENVSGWIFGCDECMNACPWNKFNREGWREFHSLAEVIEGEGKSPSWWMSLSEEKFNKLFAKSPLRRAGLQKIRENIMTLFREKE